MLTESDHSEPFSLPDNSDSYKLKAAFTERTNIRLRDQNTRLTTKIAKLEAEIKHLEEERATFPSQLRRLQQEIDRGKRQKETFERKLEMRQQRHLSQQNQYLTKAQQQALQMQVATHQEEAQAARNETSELMKKCHHLLQQLEKEEIHNCQLEGELHRLKVTDQQRTHQVKELERLFEEKAAILEAENYDLKQVKEALTLELQLHERKQQIDGLLTYQDNIGKPTHRTTHSTQRTHRPTTSRTPIDSEESTCQGCLDLEEELIESEQLIELLKEKNHRLQLQGENLRGRCCLLQTIICGGQGGCC